MLPLTVASDAPGPVMVTLSVRVTTPDVRVIVRGVLKKAGSKVMESATGIAWTRSGLGALRS